MTRMNLKKIAAATTIAGALGLTALGMGQGVANAAPPSPVASGTLWAQDGHGHGHGHGHGDGGDWGDWGPSWNGPGPYWGPGISGCVSASGPDGNVSGWLCI
jgi:hypothetical protein